MLAIITRGFNNTPLHFNMSNANLALGLNYTPLHLNMADCHLVCSLNNTKLPFNTNLAKYFFQHVKLEPGMWFEYYPASFSHVQLAPGM